MVVRPYLNLKAGKKRREEGGRGGKETYGSLQSQIKENYYLSLTSSQENFPEFSNSGKQITQNLSTLYY